MASGDTLARYTAAHLEPPTSSPCGITSRNGHLVLAFDGSSDEEAHFSDVLPSHYAGGGVTVVIAWTPATVTSGDIRWQAAFERHQDDADDLDSDSFASFQSGGDSVPSAAGELKYTEIALTDGAQMDSLAVGESFRLKIRRDADGTTGTDDVTEDVHVKSIELRET